MGNVDLLHGVPQNLREAVIAPSVPLHRASAELLTVYSLQVYSVGTHDQYERRVRLSD